MSGMARPQTDDDTAGGVKRRQPASVLPRAVIKPAERAGIGLTERAFESARARAILQVAESGATTRAPIIEMR